MDLVSSASQHHDMHFVSTTYIIVLQSDMRYHPNGGIV